MVKFFLSSHGLCKSRDALDNCRKPSFRKSRKDNQGITDQSGSLWSLGKIMDLIIFGHTMTVVLIRGRKSKKPTNPIVFYDEIMTPVDEGRAGTAACLAFSKAVNVFPQHLCVQGYNITVGGLISG